MCKVAARHLRRRHKIVVRKRINQTDTYDRLNLEGRGRGLNVRYDLSSLPEFGDLGEVSKNQNRKLLSSQRIRIAHLAEQCNVGTPSAEIFEIIILRTVDCTSGWRTSRHETISRSSLSFRFCVFVFLAQKISQSRMERGLVRND